MPQYLSPGVYVEEVDTGSKPIEGVGTSVAAFVGFTERGPREASLITNWEQYRTIYGDFIEGAYLPTSVYGFFLNGGTRCYVMRVSPAVALPQTGFNRTALEITPLLSAGSDEGLSVNASEVGSGGRYQLTIQRGDLSETFDNLSSDKKDKEGRYVETVINDPVKGSKLARAYDASGAREASHLRGPKPGAYQFGGAEPARVAAAELPPPAVRMAARGAADLPVLELRHAPGVSKGVGIEVAEVSGQEELFKLIFKAETEMESFEVSFKKGAQYLETVVNNAKTGSKLVRAKDLAGDTQLSLAERRPVAKAFQLDGVVAEVKAEKNAKMVLTTADFSGDIVARTGLSGLEALDDVTMVCVPDLMSLYIKGQMDLKGVQVVQTAIMNHCEAMHNRVAILDAPPGMTPQQIRTWRMQEANYDSEYAALYYPWIEIDNPVQKGKTMFSPPSGHMAGLWSRTDGERGVHKAPANEIVRGVVGLETQITKGEQDGLNPEGINCIRAFPGRGIRVWGARTLSSNASWKYINVRRLFNFVEASIDRGTQWVVFEPNDPELWDKIKRDVRAFLTQVWMSGALFGATADDAFFIKCDAETNPTASIDAGLVVTEIGIAPVKPAEFVVFRIGQLVQTGS